MALAEEGWIDGPVTELVARRYLEPMFSGGDAPDTLVLGCTHFPILTAAIRSVVPLHVRIIDSAATTAAEVLRRIAPSAGAADRGRVTWLATDGAERFARVGSTFFGEALHADKIEIIDL